MTKLFHIKTEKFKNQLKITCESRSWFRKPKIVSFVGSSTVWHSYPDGKRQSTHLESAFSDLAKRYEFSKD